MRYPVLNQLKKFCAGHDDPSVLQYPARIQVCVYSQVAEQLGNASMGGYPGYTPQEALPKQERLCQLIAELIQRTVAGTRMMTYFDNYKNYPKDMDVAAWLATTDKLCRSSGVSLLSLELVICALSRVLGGNSRSTNKWELSPLAMRDAVGKFHANDGFVRGTEVYALLNKLKATRGLWGATYYDLYETIMAFCVPARVSGVNLKGYDEHNDYAESIAKALAQTR
jgi:hypothetical protein